MVNKIWGESRVHFFIQWIFFFSACHQTMGKIRRCSFCLTKPGTGKTDICQSVRTSATWEKCGWPWEWVRTGLAWGWGPLHRWRRELRTERKGAVERGLDETAQRHGKVLDWGRGSRSGGAGHACPVAGAEKCPEKGQSACLVFKGRLKKQIMVWMVGSSHWLQEEHRRFQELSCFMPCY